MKRAVAVAAAVAIAVAGVGLPATTASAASRPWSGYRIAVTGKADGGFVGARMTYRRVTYRIDPNATPWARGYQEAHRVVGDRRVARAAWILSKYGAYKDAAQSAAVDVATYALLADKRIDGPRAGSRLLQTGHATSVHDLAEIMLASSRTYAGPYRLRVASTGSEIGGQVSVRAAVMSAKGARVPNLPLRISYPGAPAKELRTADDGAVTATFPALTAGYQRARVRVGRVPEWALLVRRPNLRSASRIVVAGRKTQLVKSVLVPVQAKPSVGVQALHAIADATRPIGATFTVSGSANPEDRMATVGMYGPFPDTTSAGCDPARLVSAWRLPVGPDATYATPTRKVSTPGIYLWAVGVQGNPVNLPAGACGGLTRARTVPTLKVTALDTSVLVGALFKAKVYITGLRPGYDDDVTFRLYGPYVDRAHATCASEKIVKRVTVPVTVNGGYVSPAVKVTRAGVYAWRAALPAGYLTQRALSPCAASGTFVTVKR